MLDAPGLVTALQKIQPSQYNRNVYRCVELAALIGDGTRKIQLLYDLGPRLSGQRYTAKGGARAIYVSEHPDTSYVEATGMFSSVAALSQQNALAQGSYQVNVNLSAILDITLGTNQKILETNTIELTRSWEWQMAMDLPVPTQILGEVAFASGRFQAIRFPSARRGDQVNLVIWTERILAPSFIEVTDPNYPQRIP